MPLTCLRTCPSKHAEVGVPRELRGVGGTLVRKSKAVARRKRGHGGTQLVSAAGAAPKKTFRF